jgi:prepilin-type N-terminal cleavage/methylation domain-containing protein
MATNRPARRSASRTGFTLLELMLALAISITVILVARAMVEQLNVADRRLDLATRAESRARNRSLMLARAFDRLEVGTDTLRTFAGDVGTMTFTSWCDTAGGWLERCRMRLAIDTTSGSGRLLLQSSLGDSVVLRGNFIDGSFRYIDDAESARAWVWRWGPGVNAPTMIAIISDRDTILYRIGPRG